MRYIVTIKTGDKTVSGTGSNDHAAIQDAINKLPNAWLTPNAVIRVYASYSNGDQFLYSNTISQYLESTK
jgi:hypothetical protein